MFLTGRRTNLLFVSITLIAATVGCSSTGSPTDKSMFNASVSGELTGQEILQKTIDRLDDATPFEAVFTQTETRPGETEVSESIVRFAGESRYHVQTNSLDRFSEVIGIGKTFYTRASTPGESSPGSWSRFVAGGYGSDLDQVAVFYQRFNPPDRVETADNTFTLVGTLKPPILYRGIRLGEYTDGVYTLQVDSSTFAPVKVQYEETHVVTKRQDETEFESTTLTHISYEIKFTSFGNSVVVEAPTGDNIVDEVQATPTPQPTRLPKPTAAPLPTALPGLLTDAEQILAFALANMNRANSYRAQVTRAWIAPTADPGHERDKDLFFHTELEVGPGQRGFVATAIEGNDTGRYELIHIDGIKYQRQIEPSVGEWSEIGRERALVAMGALTSSLRYFRNPELVDTRTENGIMVYELTGNYWNSASGPPLIREGYDTGYFDSITVLVSMETLLPVSISVEHGRNLIDRTTGEVIRYGTSVIEATIMDYGQVEVNVVHPRVPIPTLGPPPPTATATSSPTPTPTPISRA